MAERKSFLLRMNPGLHGAIEQWAADELRSVNAQIEFLLREAVRRAGRAREREHDAHPMATAPTPTDSD